MDSEIKNACKIKNNEKDEDFMEKIKNLSQDQLIRGQALDRVEERCHQICAQYLGPRWNAAARSTDDIIVTRITGGLTNQMYKVELKNKQFDHNNCVKDNNNDNNNVNAVAIKFYQPKHFFSQTTDNENERLTDIIVLTILSQCGINPHVYGIFDGGFVQDYIEHEQFTPKHQRDGELLAKVATLCASVNYLDVPIRKLSEDWLFSQSRDWIKKTLIANSEYELEMRQSIERLELSYLRTIDLRQEIGKLSETFKRIAPPVVFNHNDFRGSNILVSAERKLWLVDAEYAAYGTRGCDLASFIIGWDRENFDFTNFTLPDDAVIDRFVRLYIAAVDRIIPGFANLPKNSPQTIVREVKLHILSQMFVFVIFMLQQTESFIEAVPFNREENLKSADSLLETYVAIKQQLIADGTVDVFDQETKQN